MARVAIRLGTKRRTDPIGDERGRDARVRWTIMQRGGR